MQALARIPWFDPTGPAHTVGQPHELRRLLVGQGRRELVRVCLQIIVTLSLSISRRSSCPCSVAKSDVSRNNEPGLPCHPSKALKVARKDISGSRVTSTWPVNGSRGMPCLICRAVSADRILYTPAFVVSRCGVPIWSYSKEKIHACGIDAEFILEVRADAWSFPAPATFHLATGLAWGHPPA